MIQRIKRFYNPEVGSKYLNSKIRDNRIWWSWTSMGLILSVSAVIGGFDKKEARVTGCTVTASKYVTAEFSQFSEGDWDYWSETASKTKVAITVNGELDYSNSTTTVTNKAHFPAMPKAEEKWQRLSDFDKYKYHTDSKLVVSIKRMGLLDSFTEPSHKNPSCLNTMHKVIWINTWYGVSFDSDF